jgi:hypothetical protein
MGKRPDDVYEEVRQTREEISARIEEMRQRGKEDAQEFKSRVEDLFQGAGLREQVEQRPVTVLTGALGLGVALGMASESVNVRSVLGGDGKREQARSPYDRRARTGNDGFFSEITSALESAVVEEGRQLLHDWISGLRRTPDGAPNTSPPFDAL